MKLLAPLEICQIKIFPTMFFLICMNVAQAKSIPLPMAINFLNKNHACKVAIGITDLAEFEMRHNHDQLFFEKTMGVGKDWIEGFNQMLGLPKISGVLCIQDLIHGEGTINEAHGCTLTSYDVETNQYGKDVGFSPKKCENGGYQELKKPVSLLVEQYLRYSSNLEIRDPVSIFNMKVFSLIYSENKNIETVFLPHLFSAKSTPIENISKWKNWIAANNMAKENEEKIRTKEKAALEKNEEKTLQNKDKKRKKMEKLYE
jgi:hypothetical protein